MDNVAEKESKIPQTSPSEEVTSSEWEFIELSAEEEDLVYRMHKLVGDRWGLIAWRIPGRTPEEIERFWLMKHSGVFADKRRKISINSKIKS